MYDYASLADDHYINMTLNTEMQLPAQRETILGFFERVKKQFPTMRNFYTRENGDFVLEDDKDGEQHRWVSLEPRRIISGNVNPERISDAIDQHMLVLQVVPYMLSVSPLDCEALDLTLGFDFSYRGNHDALVAEVLGTSSALDGMLNVPGAQPLNFEPSITVALDETCRRQARLSIETRTNAYQVRKSEFPEDQISVYFTVRQYGSLETDASYESTLLELKQHADELLERCVIDQVLRPLQQAISAR